MTISNNNYSIRQYEIALALNNRGVSLLERRHYREAMDALKHSVRLMHLSLSPKKDLHSLKIQSQYVNLLKDSSRLLSRSVPSPLVDMNSSLIVTVMSEDANIDDYKRASASRLCNNCFFAFRIELHPTDERDKGLRTYEYGTILNNFGVAHSCYHIYKEEIKSKISKCNKMHDKAHKFLNGSTTIFSTSIATTANDNDEYFFVEKEHLIYMMILQNSMTVCFHRGKIVDARKYYSKLGDMYEINSTRPSSKYFNNLHAASA